MIPLSTVNAPDCSFVTGDIRDVSLRECYDAALCMYDSLNHLMTLNDLQQALSTIRRALKPNAPFIFDLNMEESFRTNWRGSFGKVDDDLVCVVRPSFREDDQIGEFFITVMKQEHGMSKWTRSDIRLSQRCYARQDVLAILRVVGFSNIHVLDLGAASQGKDFFCCRA